MDAVKGNFLPKLDLLSGSATRKPIIWGDVDQDENDGFIGLSASWSVYSGGRKKAELREMVSEKNVQLKGVRSISRQRGKRNTSGVD